MRRFAATLCGALLGLLPLTSAVASSGDCYDVKIRAKPIAQVPTIYPRDPGPIVISWPWFVDLKVKKVLDGDLSQAEITVLAVLHSAYVNKTRTWLLRRNTAGTFNVLRVAEPSLVPRCEANVAPALAHVRPGEGKTLEDYRRKAEENLRHYYDDDAE